MLHIDSIIQRLGYLESSYLLYGRDGFSAATFSSHTVRVLDELSPYAVYTVDNEPFILFFEEASDLIAQQELNKKIWNAQIPVAIICETSAVKIYNGCSIDKQQSLLKEIEKLRIDEVNEQSPFYIGRLQTKICGLNAQRPLVVKSSTTVYCGIYQISQKSCEKIIVFNLQLNLRFVSFSYGILLTGGLT